MNRMVLGKLASFAESHIMVMHICAVMNNTNLVLKGN